MTHSQADKEYLLYCDSSATDGPRYSHFVGTLLIGSSRLDGVVGALHALRRRLGCQETLQWSSLHPGNLRMYQQMTQALLHTVQLGHVKLRLFFHANRTPMPPALQQRIGGVPHHLILHLLRQGIGFQHRARQPTPLRLRLFFGTFPRRTTQRRQFRQTLMQLQEHPDWAASRLQLRPDDITGVRHADHLLLQLLDVTMGALNYRINIATEAHRPGPLKPATQCHAKRRLSMQITSHLQKLQPDYNPRISTPNRDALLLNWTNPYRQWCYVPGNLEDG